jgi:hypothetical protein
MILTMCVAFLILCLAAALISNRDLKRKLRRLRKAYIDTASLDAMPLPPFPQDPSVRPYSMPTQQTSVPLSYVQPFALPMPAADVQPVLPTNNSPALFVPPPALLVSQPSPALPAPVAQAALQAAAQPLAVAAPAAPAALQAPVPPPALLAPAGPPALPPPEPFPALQVLVDPPALHPPEPLPALPAPVEPPPLQAPAPPLALPAPVGPPALQAPAPPLAPVAAPAGPAPLQVPVPHFAVPPVPDPLLAMPAGAQPTAFFHPPPPPRSWLPLRRKAKKQAK